MDIILQHQIFVNHVIQNVLVVIQFQIAQSVNKDISLCLLIREG